MTDTEVIALLSSIVGLAGAITGIWWRIENRIKAAEKDAATLVSALDGSARMLAGQLAEHRLHVAETYVTKQGHRESTEQIMGAIADVKASMNGLTTRLDRIIESRSTQ